MALPLMTSRLPDCSHKIHRQKAERIAGIAEMQEKHAIQEEGIELIQIGKLYMINKW